jgi:hypothetical protein
LKTSQENVQWIFKKPRAFTKEQINAIPKKRRARYFDNKQWRKRKRARDAVTTINNYIDETRKMEHPEKELALTVLSEAVLLMLRNLRWARGEALKSKKRKLDRRRDPAEVIAMRVDLLEANIPIPIELESDKSDEADECYTRMMDELGRVHRAKDNLFPKTEVGQAWRESLEPLKKQGFEVKEIGRRMVKLSTEDSPS